MVERAKELGQPALALTDHGAMYGTIEFYKAARKAGIKPIIGCEVYVARGSRFDKTYQKDEKPHHLLLLAKDRQGYRNLMKMVSAGFLEGFYYKPRVDRELLQQYHEGLVAMSACVAGEIPRLLAEGKDAEAAGVARELQDIFGAGNFFLEIQNQNLEEQVAVNPKLVELSKQTGIPLVATNDIHYTRKEDEAAHDALLCIQTGSTLEQEDRLKFSSHEFYLKSAEEMLAAHEAWPEAVANTATVAEMCNLDIDLDQLLLPHFVVPDGFTLETYLRELCDDGLVRRYGEPSDEVLGRLEHELGIIERTGFAGYFLIVWDFVKFAKEHQIMVGPGRGSAAGSIVSYLLGITDIDPLEHGLLFERFLNPDRVTMPDIDIDFCSERRNEVIDYVTQKYGQDRVVQIITFSTMAARAATRDAGRVQGLPYGRVDKIAKLIPGPGKDGRPTTIEEALKNVAELRLEYEQDEDTKRVLDIARSLEGLTRQDSIHAAGVVIAKDVITDYAPIQRKDAKNGRDETVAQYHMKDIQDIGLLKIDFLGLSTLTVIRDSLGIIKRIRGIEIDLAALPEKDPATFKLLRDGDTAGVFQLESTGMRQLLKSLQPSSFHDIVACLALFRPGPLQGGMVQDFVDRKHGRKPIQYLHPSLEHVLKETYGTLVYQEQVMQIATDLAGFSMSEADVLRKAMGKKEKEVVAAQREKFVSGASAQGISGGLSGKIFDLMAHFAEYGFNKSHSAGYAVISYQTAYLKANFPVEYMAALLTSVMGDKDKVPLYVNECRRLGIEVLPPDANESYRKFTVVEDKIRFGLSAVRNVGDAAIASIIEARQDKGPYTSIFDFCEKVDLAAINKRALDSLIKAGCFDFTGMTRRQLLTVYEKAVDLAQRRQKDLVAGQTNLFDEGGVEEEPPSGESTGEGMAEEMPKTELLALEKEMLGLYVSDHPLLGMEDALATQTAFPLSEAREHKDGQVYWVGGMISRLQEKTTRNGETMAVAELEDLGGAIEVVFWPSLYQRYRELLKSEQPLRVRGRLDVRDEGVQIVAQEVEEFAAAESGGTRSLRLRVNEAALRPDKFDELKRILRDYPGQLPVYVQLKGGAKETVYMLGNDFRVDPVSGLYAELKMLLGSDSIQPQA